MKKPSGTPDVAETLQVSVIPISRLQPYDRNARTHSDEQIEQIVSSIQEWGWTSPIVADLSDAGVIAAGHGRLLAAQRIYAAGSTIRLPNGRVLPIDTVPVIDCAGWSDDQRRAYVLADNQLALNAGWDDDLLKIELGELRELDFDLSLIGFDEQAVAALLDGVAEQAKEEPKASLAERFGLVPFSVLNARDGWWQDRKRAWLALGIQSEVGRGENLLKMSDTMLEPDPIKRAAKGRSKRAA